MLYVNNTSIKIIKVKNKKNKDVSREFQKASVKSRGRKGNELNCELVMNDLKEQI